MFPHVADEGLSRRELGDLLHTHGAVLLRGASPGSAAEFERFGRSICGDLLPYRDRATPRRVIEGLVYSSTDAPPHFVIPFHSEMSFSKVFPRRLVFRCVDASPSGGATPLADLRRVTARLADATLGRFEEHGVRYVRNFAAAGRGPGLDWKRSFEVDTREELEEYAERAGLDITWDGDACRASRSSGSLATHPTTGDRVWFNHLTAWHDSGLAPALRAALLRDRSPDEMPQNVFFGDGAPIADDMVEEVRAAFEAERTTFAWAGGDVLLIENLLCAHAREPFRGARQVEVVMGDALTDDDVRKF